LTYYSLTGYETRRDSVDKNKPQVAKDEIQ